MNQPFDVIVLGLGANGSSSLYHLSKTGLRVCGIDRFAPPHNHGSSHGESRIIRQAYHEHPMYVPLVREAYELWHELEQASGRQLFVKTGGLLMGADTSRVVRGAKQSAEHHSISYEYLARDEIQQRFPAFVCADETTGVLEAEAGILFPEKCIKANISLSVKRGALVLLTEKVTCIDYDDDIISIHTNRGSYKTHKLIVAAGAWLNELLPALHLPLTIERQVLYWFQNEDAAQQPLFTPDAMPVFIWEYETDKLWYGLPDIGSGIKVALHHAGTLIKPDLLSQDVSKKEIEQISSLVSRYIHTHMQFSHSSVCMYTNTPDEHFIIDYHPQNRNIIIGSPCSGHGFKFSSLTGKLLADMALEKDIPFDLSPFRINRFSTTV